MAQEWILAILKKLQKLSKFTNPVSFHIVKGNIEIQTEFQKWMQNLDIFWFIIALRISDGEEKRFKPKPELVTMR